jgi:hypothetical protein
VAGVNRVTLRHPGTRGQQSPSRSATTLIFIGLGAPGAAGSIFITVSTV